MVSLWIDAQTAHRPTALEAATLVATAAALVRRPFRTRTMFNRYELIAPESGVLIGSQAEGTVEVPFQLLVSLHPLSLLGESVSKRVGHHSRSDSTTWIPSMAATCRCTATHRPSTADLPGGADLQLRPLPRAGRRPAPGPA